MSRLRQTLKSWVWCVRGRRPLENDRPDTTTFPAHAGAVPGRSRSGPPATPEHVRLRAGAPRSRLSTIAAASTHAPFGIRGKLRGQPPRRRPQRQPRVQSVLASLIRRRAHDSALSRIRVPAHHDRPAAQLRMPKHDELIQVHMQHPPRPPTQRSRCPPTYVLTPPTSGAELSRMASVCP